MSSAKTGPNKSAVYDASAVKANSDRHFRKKEIVRRKNGEEAQNCFFNIFFIFFCRYPCRCSPVTDADICETDTRDDASLVLGRASRRWNPRCEAYMKAMEEYEKVYFGEEKNWKENKKNDGKEFVCSVKMPSKPNLCVPLFLSVVSFSSVFGIICLFGQGLQLLQPVFMARVLDAMSSRNTSEAGGEDYPIPVLWIILIVLNPLMETIITNWGWRFLWHVNQHVRASLLGLLYTKIMRMNKATQLSMSAGKILTLVSNDADNVACRCYAIYLFFPQPFLIIFSVVMMSITLGITSLVSFALMIAYLFLEIAIVHFMFTRMRRYLLFSAEKNRITNETLQGIRVVKFTGLENVFVDRINEARDKQVKSVFGFITGWQSFHVISRVMPVLISCATASIFILVNSTSQEDFAKKVIPGISYISMCAGFLSMPDISQLIASYIRIRNFLITPDPKFDEFEAPKDKGTAIRVENGTFAWVVRQVPVPIAEIDAEKEAERKVAEKEASSVKTHPSSGPSLSSSPEEFKPTLKSVSFTVPKGSLTMIIGMGSCGKSSVGSALIGDMLKLSGTVEVAGSIAYYPQTPWISTNTVRNNITFGEEFNEKKYLETIRACSLTRDINLMPAGDATAIGEKGASLSGGQKSRIQLARCVYADADNYILDDPFSAVDVGVGEELFEKCLRGRLAAKTRIFITNNLQLLDKADQILVMKEGTIIARGTFQELAESGIDFSQFGPKKEEEDEDEIEMGEKEEAVAEAEEKKEKSETVAQEEELKPASEHNEAALTAITDEEHITKMIGLSTIWEYFSSLIPGKLVLPFFLLMFAAVAMNGIAAYWQGKIGSTEEFTYIGMWGKLLVYVVMALILLVIYIGYTYLLGIVSMHSDSNVHHNLLNHVIHCPSEFFDSTPIGRIINRFSSDIFTTDIEIHENTSQILIGWLEMIAQVIIVSIEQPIFLAFGVPVLILLMILMVVFFRLSINFQRLTSISRSPVVAHASDTVTEGGLSTIRTSGRMEEWRVRFYELINEWSQRSLLSQEGALWVAVVTSVITQLFTAGVVFIGWYSLENNMMAVAINATTMFSGVGKWLVNQSGTYITNFTLFERVRFYSTRTPQETTVVTKKPAASWPAQGKIQFYHVSFKYRPGLPMVAQDQNFTIKGGEKIGVCGRTGAGKSSLMHALFRFVELDPKLAPPVIDMATGFPMKISGPPNRGHVLLDDVDISKVPLRRLRQAIAIIPQDPTLFTGTVRFNLDLASKCTDEKIWEVLNMIGMREAVAALPNGLDTELNEGGSVFSCGRKQLLCLGRAILNNCRVLCMDEATAKMDLETDAKIQDVIHKQFASQTVIIIAHRLSTVMKCDRIMKIDAGKVVAFDTPQNLHLMG